MDTALPQKLFRNLAKANCTGNWVCPSCDIVVIDLQLSCVKQGTRKTLKHFYPSQSFLHRNNIASAFE